MIDLNSNYNKYQKFSILLAFIALFISVAAIIWAGSKIDSKAEYAYKFVDKNIELPIKVENNRIDIFENKLSIEKFRDSIGTIIKIQTKQEDICTRLEILAKDIKELEKRK